MLIIQKYGGTSVGTPHRIRRVASRIAERHRAGDRVVAVVSAMGQTTDELWVLARKITDRPSRREMDMLLTAGERISMALLSMALETLDVPAISFTGSQSGIITDTSHSRARILEIRPIRIGPELEKGKVVIVAGFQGVSRDKEVTTLGRGGSDTTAVALAVGLGAGACEIYTDVPGVMSADPRVVPEARLLPALSWDAMLELSCCGAGVVHSRAVELARRRERRFEVRSAFRKRGGTVVDGTPIEQGPEVAAVTGHPRVARVRMHGLSPAGDPGAFFAALSETVDDVSGLAHAADAGKYTCTFHVPLGGEPGEVLNRLAQVARAHGGSLDADTDHAAVTLVGAGIVHAPAVAARASRVLSAAGITPAAIVTGQLSLTFLVPAGSYAEAQRVLHGEFVEPS